MLSGIRAVANPLLEGLIACYSRDLDILSTTTGYYGRVNLCLCEFLLDVVCDVAFKSPKPTSNE